MTFNCILIDIQLPIFTGTRINHATTVANSGAAAQAEKIKKNFLLASKKCIIFQLGREKRKQGVKNAAKAARLGEIIYTFSVENA